MRIAQVAPLAERVPPVRYGGTERVVYALTEELVRRGHDVTLFASGDSLTSARLASMSPRGRRLDGASDGLFYEIAMLEEVYAQANRFDLIHAHVDGLAFPFARQSDIPTVHTMHGRLDLPAQLRMLSRFPEQRLVSISRSQRLPSLHFPLNWIGTVHNGVRLQHFTLQESPSDLPYLVFLGRISPEKGPVEAIQIARRAGMPLKIAAKIDQVDKGWAEEKVIPLFDLPGIEYIGEVDEREKAELLAGAAALLFPIDWPEPFGMTMIESMASGTPVIARRRGSVEEILVDGVTGFICETDDEMVQAVGRLSEIDRAQCRRHVEMHFSAEKMTSGYEVIYERMLSEWTLPATDQVIAELFGETKIAESRTLAAIEQPQRIGSSQTQSYPS
ncbi:MAG TPA: glycosyltransferase family 4 protein [Nitrolancea sp.]|nr:glycosyltransferase family 4 protein [Nitrolancea sp.]